MHSTRFAIAVSFLLASCITATAGGLRDTVRHDIRQYNPEIGFYQKAYSDTGDPRFMFTDEKRILEFGIGGTLHVIGFYGFCGAVDTDEFTPSAIAVPTDYTNQFGTRISGSELHAKVRVNIRRHKLIGFLKLGGTSDEKVKISQAYVSFDGLSLGKMPSFFMDLAAGPQTVGGKGPNTEVDVTRTAFGYTYRFPKHWEIAASIEHGKFNVNDAVQKSAFKDNLYLYDDYQTVPDIVAKVKYGGEAGHVQVAGIYRSMNYWVSDAPVQEDSDGETRSCNGYGVALSGKIRACKWMWLTGQSVVGRGISSYLKDLDGVPVAVGLNPRFTSDMPELKPTLVFGGYLAAQMQFSKHISSSLTFGVERIYHDDGILYADPLKRTLYGALNVFWNFSDYASVGVEYLFGAKYEYTATPEEPTYGQSNRIAVSMSIFF